MAWRDDVPTAALRIHYEDRCHRDEQAVLGRCERLPDGSTARPAKLDGYLDGGL
jgi:hypothetical protein